MGNAHNPAQLHKESLLAQSKFDKEEIHNITKTWEDLADRANGKGIDKETFLKYFPMTGLLGERLFAQFDFKKTGLIDLDEFVMGLAAFCRGTRDDKIKFIFNMYDTDHNNTVSKQELTCLLNQVPKYVLHPELVYGHTRSPSASPDLGKPQGRNSPRPIEVAQATASISSAVTPISGLGEHPELPQLQVDVADHEENGSSDGDNLEPVDEYTNHDMVEKAFAECDINHEGRLTYEQFKLWVERTPGLIEYLDNIMPWASKDDSIKRHSQRDALPIYGVMKRNTSSNSVSQRLLRTNGIGSPSHGQSSDSLSRQPNMQRAVSQHTGEARSESPLICDNVSIASVAPPPSITPSVNSGVQSIVSGTHTLTSGMHSVTTGINAQGHGQIHKPSPLAMPQPTMARANSISLHRPPTSPVHMNSPSPPLHQLLENIVIEEGVRALLTQAMEHTSCDTLHKILYEILESENRIRAPHLTESQILETIVSKSGYLWKKGGKLHWWNKRWCLLSGNCIYYYNHESDVRPKGVIFLSGNIIEKVNEEASEIKGYYGFEILHQDFSSGKGTDAGHHRHDQRILYARSAEERENWIKLLQHAAQVIPIEEDYFIGRELGRGRFSVVCECTRKADNVKMAVKIIEKATLDSDEKELLRTEIAALKLVHHPNIVNLEGLYETRTHMYIVMEKLLGGELYNRIVGHPRFTEVQAAHLIRPLLEAVAYLHDMGIVHRDLKPENILCGENLEDIKLADFGLSKMLLPREKMDTACGTLSYVAPEVLTMQGYGKEADLWSIGVIMFLLVCGKLPFDGVDNDEIIRATINADLKAPPQVWSKLTEDTKSLITALLQKSPKLRITAREALKHHFFEQFFPYERTHRRTRSIGDRSHDGSRVLSTRSIQSTAY
jgi:Ca2+-binding EF-hand superfamily protein